jgi:hypothetical protein
MVRQRGVNSVGEEGVKEVNCGERKTLDTRRIQSEEDGWGIRVDGGEEGRGRVRVRSGSGGGSRRAGLACATRCGQKGTAPRGTTKDYHMAVLD